MQVAEPGASRPASTALIEKAVQGWAGKLIDLSRRNNLLYFRDLKVGTLDLLDADDMARDRLLAGGRVRASQLFPSPEAFQRARKRLTEIRRKVRLLNEERGIDAGFVASGMLSWPAPQSGRVAATTRSPILLRSLTIHSKGANAADFELVLGDSAELNPVLAYALDRQVGIDTTGVADVVAEIALDRQLDVAVKLLQERAATEGIPVTFEPKLVAAVFAYEKLPMVRDLEESTELLASHALVAALAGDAAARSAFEDQPELPEVDLNKIMPEDEHLVLDADPSQQSAIATVLAGENLILQGPPGTGKSQTIANLIAEAAARGKTVLFVAQKRAAIDAVVNNLRRLDLAEIILDLHDPKTSRKAVVEQIKVSMERASREPPANVEDTNRQLIERRRRLMEFSSAMRAVREPCGLSIEQMQQQLIALPPERDLGVLLGATTLGQLPNRRLPQIEEALKEFIEHDGLRLWRGQTPWAAARSITSESELRSTRLQLDELTGVSIRDARTGLEWLLQATGLPRPTTLAQWSDALNLMAGVTQTIALHGQDVFGPQLDEARAAFGTSAWRRQGGISIGFWRRRTLRRAITAARSEPASRTTIFAELSAAVDQKDHWARMTGGRPPRHPPNLDDITSRYERLRSELAAIAATTLLPGLADQPEPAMDRSLRQLLEDERMLVSLPRLNQQRALFEQLQLSELLDRLAGQYCKPAEAAECLRISWLSSWLREMQMAVPEYAGFTASAQDRIIEEFRDADVEHMDRTAGRVRRRVAEFQMSARDNWPKQRQIVLDQVGRKARHKPIRQLVNEAAELLLAVRPCWAMSPLVVSQVLPGDRLFDFVVFDEASQIEPADAIPAIMRGGHVVVAGDNKQLPPTPFFATTRDEDEDGTDEDSALGDFESILDRLGTYVQAKTLSWHYRSQDERLIAFSNREIYGNRLVTFPGTARASSLRHVLVDGPTPPGTRGCAPAEVQRVAELVVEHAEQRPGDSLGVIALGVSGAGLITARLRELRSQRPDLEEFFDEDAAVGRRFFVKNLENVQGDERDAIVLSVGGSRTATGAVNHNFGPINQQGGERRLNVAVTRARKSLTIVSTFTHSELLEERLNSRGLRFLRDYLRFATQLASTPDPDGRASTSMTPVERQILERLRQAGVPVFPRYGVSGSPIDIAVAHPDRPGELLLAIEIDGEDYHRAGRSVRERDRLRPEQLNRLGWRHHRVWTAGWLRDPESELDFLNASLDAARHDVEPADQRIVHNDPRHRNSPVPEPSVTPTRSRPRPGGLPRGLPIDDQNFDALVELARWIRSDGLLRDDEEMIELMRAELGYQRRGKKILETLRLAVQHVRRDGRR